MKPYKLGIMYFSQQRERSPNVFLYGPRQPLGKSMKHVRAGINLHKCNVQLDHFKYNTSFGCHYLTRANFTGRDVASCEKGGCNPGIKTKCLIHGTSEIYPWTGTATHTKTQKRHFIKYIHVYLQHTLLIMSMYFRP